MGTTNVDYQLRLFTQAADIRWLLQREARLRRVYRVRYCVLAGIGLLAVKVVLSVFGHYTPAAIAGNTGVALIVIGSLACAYFLHLKRTIKSSIEERPAREYIITSDRDMHALFGALLRARDTAVRKGREVEATRLMHEIAELYSLGMMAHREIAQLHELARD